MTAKMRTYARRSLVALRHLTSEERLLGRIMRYAVKYIYLGPTEPYVQRRNHYLANDPQDILRIVHGQTRSEAHMVHAQRLFRPDGIEKNMPRTRLVRRGVHRVQCEAVSIAK
jgi:hypothetical protein